MLSVKVFALIPREEWESYVESTARSQSGRGLRIPEVSNMDALSSLRLQIYPRATLT